MRALLLGCAAVLVVCGGLVMTASTTACTVKPLSSDAGTTDSDGGTSNTSTCGMSFSGDRWNASCESWSDTYCCDPQEACAASADCLQLFACIDACPTPRKDTCTNTCTGQATSAAISLLGDISDCTKQAASDGTAIPSTCAWP